MKKKLTQADMRAAIMDRFKDGNAKNVQFMTSIENGNPRFSGAVVTFTNGTSHMLDSEVVDTVMEDLIRMEEYQTVKNSDTCNITLDMGVRMITGKDGDKTPVPVFRGCEVEFHAAEQAAGEAPDQVSTKSKDIHVLADMRRAECITDLNELTDTALLQMMRVHYGTHNCLPGEKAVKDKVEDFLHNADEYPFGLDPQMREDLIQSYAATRIRETPVPGASEFVKSGELAVEPVQQIVSKNGDTVNIGKIDVALHRGENGSVYVTGKNDSAFPNVIGTLPENFNRNSPMYAKSCRAEMQVIDYSGGALKNVSVRLIADTDVMSGDVLELDEDMLAGLEQDTGLER